MQRKPKSVNILGQQFKVVYRSEMNDKSLLGETILDERSIHIRSDLKGKDLHDTLLHEIIHGVLLVSGLDFALKATIVEAITRALEHGLASLVELKSLKSRGKK